MGKIKDWLLKLIDKLQEAEKANADTTPTKPRPSEPYVFVTAKGKRYHWDRLCPCLRNASEIKMDISEARKAGYTACDKCCSAAVHRHD